MKSRAPTRGATTKWLNGRAAFPPQTRWASSQMVNSKASVGTWGELWYVLITRPRSVLMKARIAAGSVVIPRVRPPDRGTGRGSLPTRSIGPANPYEASFCAVWRSSERPGTR